LRNSHKGLSIARVTLVSLFVLSSVACTNQNAYSSSEAEICKKSRDFIEDLSSWETKSSSKTIDDLEADVLHLQGVNGVLAGSSSGLAASADFFVESATTTLKVLDLDNNAEVSSSARYFHVEKFVDELSEGYQEIQDFCQRVGLPETDEKWSPDIKQFFPEGLWSSESGTSFFNSGLQSHDEWWSISQSGSFSQADFVGTNLIVFCNPSDEQFGIFLNRSTGNMIQKDLGPDGPVQIKYSIDDGADSSLDGYYAAGRLWPFVNKLEYAQFEKQGAMFWNLIASAEEKLKVTVDSPGENFTSVFYVFGQSQLQKDLDAFRCLDFT